MSNQKATTFECGNPKPVGQVGCDRCRNLEVKSATTSKRESGHRDQVFNTSSVTTACNKFLASRGLNTNPLRR